MLFILLFSCYYDLFGDICVVLYILPIPEFVPFTLLLFDADLHFHLPFVTLRYPAGATLIFYTTLR